jgi:PPM family protein phosphatase
LAGTNTASRAVRSAALTDTGRMRKSNEDAYWCDPGGEIFLLADGMGGHDAGEVASQSAVQTIRDTIQRSCFTGLSPAAALEQAILSAHALLRELSQQDIRLHRMGTTILVAWRVDNRSFWIAHVGDSRVYRLREGRLRKLTEDHTVFNQVRKSRRIAADLIDLALKKRLSQALGSSEFVSPKILEVKLRSGDRFLLCSDGLTDMVDDQEITAILGRLASPEQTCLALVQAANHVGGEDNITVIVVDNIATAEYKMAKPEIRDSGFNQ